MIEGVSKEIRIHHIIAMLLGAGLLFVGMQVPQVSRSTNAQIIVQVGGAAFGPETFIRTTGSPNIFTRSFTVSNPVVNFFLRIENGDGSHSKVDSAVIPLNGVVVLSPSDDNNINRRPALFDEVSFHAIILSSLKFKLI
ncbi:MAG: hypothetical protein A2633_01975 [Candidatus Sungbacteria bacterium RIFCSPHIGHO2_01_FULL_47_32]|uniref:Uncharacterized protein n=1 Tax=Candidatus Sungbacteria bacterium RIFCSPHIGHO2_01_FULL_47_32 TaxID=1802264 RepID=A0A1G2K4K6_9BACT|nr:MAG: hypothetical protein A2633_01975 [Candidatus Sungbacteria bacterium RIFCSPHIGHO2_01_FULL_47_32]